MVNGLTTTARVYVSTPRATCNFPDCLEHQPKSDWDWECPERVVSIVDLLVKPRAFEHHELEVTTDFSAVNTESLMRVHTGPYIKFVDSMGKSFKVGCGENERWHHDDG